jgi:peptidyl-prolyl cis-trans isomerase A (cyclophilin A)
MKKILLFLSLAAIAGCTRQQAPRVVIETPLGAIIAEVYPDRAPTTAGNFLRLVDAGAYNQGSAAFYRVVRLDNQTNPVKIEVIQGGLNNRDEYEPIAHETTNRTGIKHIDGTLSMARSEPGTASSEFFICIGDQPSLDFGGNRNADGQGFAAFGQVVEGMDVVRKIQQLRDTTQYLVEPLPITAIKILSTSIPQSR